MRRRSSSVSSVHSHAQPMNTPEEEEDDGGDGGGRGNACGSSCCRWLLPPSALSVQSVCLAALAALVALLLRILSQDNPLDEMRDLCSEALALSLWCGQNPQLVMLRLFKELRIERFVSTAVMTWIIANVNACFRSRSKILAESYEQRVSLQVNFITRDPQTGCFELDWVTMSEEPIAVNKVFRDMLAKARTRPPALPETCPTLCPLGVRGLAAHNKSADQMMWQMLKGYASSKLINNLGISHTLSGLPVKVSDVVICLTFERHENVGRNPAGRKMRLLVMSMSDLEYVYENSLRREDGLPPCLRTKTGTKWSKMRLQQLEELARHMRAQPMSDRRFDTTRCFGLIRLYTPVTWRDICEEEMQDLQNTASLESNGNTICDQRKMSVRSGGGEGGGRGGESEALQGEGGGVMHRHSSGRTTWESMQDTVLTREDSVGLSHYNSSSSSGTEETILI